MFYSYIYIYSIEYNQYKYPGSSLRSTGVHRENKQIGSTRSNNAADERINTSSERKPRSLMSDIGLVGSEREVGRNPRAKKT